ncbi:MAG TPA: GNAT family N-acetyltransferase [Herpetosiphonaceae bacterium]
MHLRPATPADTLAIAEIHTDNWRRIYRGLLDDAYLTGPIQQERLAVWSGRISAPPASQSLMVAERDERILGFSCAYGAEDPRWGSHLANLHVARSAQRQGVGRELMRAVAQWAAAAYPGAGLFLWVVEANAGARRFYELMGGASVEADVWHAPDGSAIAKLRYAWPDPLLVGSPAG